MKLESALSKLSVEELLTRAELLGENSIGGSTKVALTEIHQSPDGSMFYNVDLSDGRNFLIDFGVYVRHINFKGRIGNKIGLRTQMLSAEWMTLPDGKTLLGVAVHTVATPTGPVDIKNLIEILVKTTVRIHKWSESSGANVNVRRGNV